MPSLVLDIALPAERRAGCLVKGTPTGFVLRSRDGRRISLPVHHLRPFVTREGVFGSFELEFAEQGQLIGLHRLR